MKNDVPTRALNSFESRALDSLRTGKETSFDEIDQSLLMLGALRASKTCLECHNGKEGDLLGAFSYRFGKSAPAGEK